MATLFESYERRIDKINAADAMIFQSEKNLKEYGDKIPADKKGAIENALGQLKEAHKSSDIAAIGRATEALNTAWHAASEDMAKAAQAQQGANPNPGAQGPAGGQTSSEEVKDVDFEEVK